MTAATPAQARHGAAPRRPRPRGRQPGHRGAVARAGRRHARRHRAQGREGAARAGGLGAHAAGRAQEGDRRLRAGSWTRTRTTSPPRLTSEIGKPITQARNELDRRCWAASTSSSTNVEAALADEVVHDEGRPGASASPTSRSASSPTSRPGTIRTSSARNVFVPALLAGNAVLYKPSEFATLTGLAIAGMLHEAGVPDDVFAPVVGAARSAPRCCRAAVDGVFFTGSYATGRKIAEAVGRASSMQGAARARRQGPGLRVPTTSTSPAAAEGHRPTAPSTTPARAAARSSASTCTSAIHDAFVERVRGRGRGLRRRRSHGRDDLHRPAHPRGAARACSRRRSPTRWRRARRSAPAARASTGRRQLLRADRAHRASTTTWR